jgi:hypothetical protein
MLEVELGLLSDRSIGVERRLDAGPQNADVHVGVCLSTGARCVSAVRSRAMDQRRSRRRCAVGGRAVGSGVSGVLSAAVRPSTSGGG